MKYVILIHANPRPWGHPTGDFTPELQALPESERRRLEADFEVLLADLTERGELIGGEALADPAAASIYRWDTGRALATDGPYAEAEEHLAGFFLIDVAGRERAAEIAAALASPGDTVELRAVRAGGDDR